MMDTVENRTALDANVTATAETASTSDTVKRASAAAKKTTVKRRKKPGRPRTKTARIRKRRVTFTYTGKPGCRVFVTGDFNNWDEKGKRMVDKEGNGVYSVGMNIATGIYEYKFIVDSSWCVDPACKDWVPNDFGTLNSVIHVE